jgi:hypothetical protein
MATKKKSNGLIKGQMVYDTDSRKKTYHRYQVKAEVAGEKVVGTIYIPFGHAGEVNTLRLEKKGGAE